MPASSSSRLESAELGDFATRRDDSAVRMPEVLPAVGRGVDSSDSFLTIRRVHASTGSVFEN